MNPCEDSVKALFDRIIELESPEERVRLLDAECGTDPELRTEVEGLLHAYEQAGSFLEHPALGDVPTEVFAGTNTDPNDENCKAILEKPKIPLGLLAPSEEEGSQGRLGQYEILESIGRGGMGIVLKGHDTKLNRIVAVKVLAPELASNATARTRFSKEAQAAGAVSHDHVVTIHAVEECGPQGERNLPYLVMEYVDGLSLQQKIDRDGPLELKEILRIGHQIAAGLSAAHLQGLIHRDVKPSNILLQNGVQRVKITDFGLARAVDDIGITRTGEIAGTPQYMSPEQAQAHAVDPRSDLFSLGSVLYAMCTGRSPFRADSAVAALRRVCDDTPRPIREINPDIPVWLTAIIDRLLEKDPADRIQTATEVADLLGQHLAHVQDPGSSPFPGSIQPIAKHDKSKKQGQRRWLVAGLVLIAMIGTLGVMEATGVTKLSATVIRIVTGEGTLVIEVDDPSVKVSLDGEELSISGAGIREIKLRPGEHQFLATKAGQPVREELVSIERNGKRLIHVTREFAPNGVLASPLIAKLEGHTGAVVYTEFSSDGRMAVSCSGFPIGDSTIRLWEIPSGKLIRTIAGSDNVLKAKFSPDDRHVLSCQRNGLVTLWDVATGRKVQEWQPSGKVNRASLSQNARYVYAIAGKSLQIWDIVTGEMVEEKQVPFNGSFSHISQFELFDNERKAVVVIGISHDKQTMQTIYSALVWNLEKNTTVVLASNDGISGGGQIDLAVNPDTRQLVLCPRTGGRRFFDLEKMKFTGEIASAGATSATFTPDGRHVLWSSKYSTYDGMQIVDVARQEIIAQLPVDQPRVWSIAVSPDQRMALTACGIESEGDCGLYLWRLPEAVWPKDVETAELKPFAVLNGDGIQVNTFNTLADAIIGSNAGDTVEIRGNGPFVTPPIYAGEKDMTIRAAVGYHPVIRLTPGDNGVPWETTGSLTLEGLELHCEAPSTTARYPVGISCHSGRMFVANCRFHMPRRYALWLDPPVCLCEVQNSLFAGDAMIAVAGKQQSGGCWTLDNCVFAVSSIAHFGWDQNNQKQGGGVRLRRCSVASADLLFHMNVSVVPAGNGVDTDNRPFALDVTDSVLHSPRVLGVHCLEMPLNPKVSPEIGTAADFCARLMTWRGMRNAHTSTPSGTVWTRFSTGDGEVGFALLGEPSDLDSWRAFSDSDEVGCVEGTVRFRAAALLPKLATAEDFRLRPDSAGYRAGPDGKDLGADVDLVGPGEAYERWKRTPDYQDWQKQTRRLLAGDTSQQMQPFVVLSREGREVRKFKTLTDAVIGSNAGDSVEIRGNGPFELDEVVTPHALTIRAAQGFSPVLMLSKDSAILNRPLFHAEGPLVLEGLDLRRVQPTTFKGGGSQFPHLILSDETGPLRVTNCRLILSAFPGPCNVITAWNIAQLEVRNTEILTSGDGATPIGCDTASGGRYVIENCVSSFGEMGFTLPDVNESDASFLFRHNTLLGCTIVCGLSTNSAVLVEQQGNPRIRLDLEGNIIATATPLKHQRRGALHFHQYGLPRAMSPAEAEKLLGRSVRLRDQQNVYTCDGANLLTFARDWVPLASERGTSLDDWNTFWSLQETGSAIGSVQPKGGNIAKKVLSDPQSVSAEDFRLRPDSAGYHAGPGGKDLGADIDLVGPGAAYERWKKTQAYQEWQKESAESLKVSADQ